MNLMSDPQTIIGLGDQLPRLELKGKSPRDIDRTIYFVDATGHTFANVWSAFTIGETYKWASDTGAYRYKLANAERNAYYYYDAKAYAFIKLGNNWDEAATSLIARGLAVKVSNTVNIDQMIRDEADRLAPKPKPNRTGKNLKYGVNL